MSEKQPNVQKGADSQAGVTIVVDAMGGDYVPAQPVAGAILAARRFPDTKILLSGPPSLLEAELAKSLSCPANIEILPAFQYIGMHESPVVALRAKKDNSITVGIEAISQGKADAFLSAGNTGAVVAASTLGLGLLEGVQKPGIAVPMVALDHMVVIIDCGANIQCKPTHLLQYAVMATEFAIDVWGIKSPRVGLLNVGEEDSKGTNTLREAFDLIKRAGLEFVGNVEPEGIFFGKCDIVVCDGFVGNVLLKTSESVASKLLKYLKGEIQKSIMRKLGFALCRRAFSFVQNCDYAEYGGAPLLGVEGAVIISHGRSDAKAIESAVREARSFVRRDVNQKMAAAVGRAMATCEKNSSTHHESRLSTG
jgi:glycerol-3-phosphate acyltransferase PlsX